jgi:hypothetical protein
MLMQMRSLHYLSFIVVLLTAFTLFCGGTSVLAAMPEGSEENTFEQKVASLGLGFGEYHIANKLSPAQKEKAQKTLVEKSYPGTYTFTDGDDFILVEKASDSILAVYRKNEQADRDQLKQMIADLMAMFGNPTSEAHDQIIYWVYDEKGKIPDEEYETLREGQERPVLATVKFKSKLTFTESNQENDQENSIHCIVSSPRLLEKFYQQ